MGKKKQSKDNGRAAGGVKDTEKGKQKNCVFERESKS